MVFSGNRAFLVLGCIDGAAGLLLQLFIATSVIKMVVSVEDMGQGPPLFSKRCLDRALWRDDRGASR